LIDLVPRINDVDLKMIKDVMTLHKPSGLQILTGPPSPELAEKVSGNDFSKILELLRQLFTYIVVNTDSYVNDSCLAALDAADTIVLLTAQEIAAIRNTRSFLELWDGLNMSRDRIMLAINRHNKQNSITAEKISEILRHPVSDTIPTDEETLLRAANLGIPVMLEKKKSPVMQSITDLADAVRKKITEMETEERSRLFRVA
jgi:pilus assembly protein CpaE